MRADKSMIRELLLTEIESGRLETMCRKKGFKSLESFLTILAAFKAADKGDSPSPG